MQALSSQELPTLPVLLPKWKSSKLKIETSVRWFIWPIQHQTPTIGTTLRVGWVSVTKHILPWMALQKSILWSQPSICLLTARLKIGIWCSTAKIKGTNSFWNLRKFRTVIILNQPFEKLEKELQLLVEKVNPLWKQIRVFYNDW